MNQGSRKYQTLDVVHMYATLTEAHWRGVLETACTKGSVEKLISWRYGMQAGLADAASKGLSSDKLDLWVIKRLRNLEKAMKWILRQKYPMPGDKVIPKYAKGKRIDFVQDAITAKKSRDKEFEMFLRRSSF
jgi:hypothetical protein